MVICYICKLTEVTERSARHLLLGRFEEISFEGLTTLLITINKESVEESQLVFISKQHENDVILHLHLAIETVNEQQKIVHKCHSF